MPLGLIGSWGEDEGGDEGEGESEGEDEGVGEGQGVRVEEVRIASVRAWCDHKGLGWCESLGCYRCMFDGHCNRRSRLEASAAVLELSPIAASTPCNTARRSRIPSWEQAHLLGTVSK